MGVAPAATAQHEGAFPKGAAIRAGAAFTAAALAGIMPEGAPAQARAVLTATALAGGLIHGAGPEALPKAGLPETGPPIFLATAGLGARW